MRLMLSVFIIFIFSFSINADVIQFYVLADTPALITARPRINNKVGVSCRESAKKDKDGKVLKAIWKDSEYTFEELLAFYEQGYKILNHTQALEETKKEEWRTDKAIDIENINIEEKVK